MILLEDIFEVMEDDMYGGKEVNVIWIGFLYGIIDCIFIKMINKNYLLFILNVLVILNEINL